jgi:hypothetical protein
MNHQIADQIIAVATRKAQEERFAGASGIAAATQAGSKSLADKVDSEAWRYVLQIALSRDIKQTAQRSFIGSISLAD